MCDTCGSDVHDVAPVFKRGTPKERQQCDMKRAHMNRVIYAKHRDTDDGIQVEQHAQQQADVGDGRHGLQQTHHEQSELGQSAHL